MGEELPAHTDVLQAEGQIVDTHGIAHTDAVAEGTHGPVGDERGILRGQDDGVEEEVLGDETAHQPYSHGDGRAHEGPPEHFEVLQEGHFLTVTGCGQNWSREGQR